MQSRCTTRIQLFVCLILYKVTNSKISASMRSFCLCKEWWCCQSFQRLLKLSLIRDYRVLKKRYPINHRERELQRSHHHYLTFCWNHKKHRDTRWHLVPCFSSWGWRRKVAYLIMIFGLDISNCGFLGRTHQHESTAIHCVLCLHLLS